MALRALPKGWESSVEAQLLTGLVQLNQNDLVGALARVRWMRMLCVCACVEGGGRQGFFQFFFYGGEVFFLFFFLGG